MRVRTRIVVVVGGLLLFGGQSALGAVPRVANFSTGAPGTKTYEQLSFWVMANGSKQVVYTYGARRRELTLRRLPTPSGSLRVRFSNGATLRIRRSGANLSVTGITVRYAKTFRWRYEGPVNGVGTACTVCVPRSQAVAFVQRRFLLGTP